MRGRSGLVGLVLVVALFVGCRARPPARIGIGPTVPATAMWRGAVETLAARGYVFERTDATRGTIVVSSRELGSQQELVVQLYADGWAELSMPGARGGRRLSDELIREYLELAVALRDRLIRQRPSPAPDNSGGDGL